MKSKKYLILLIIPLLIGILVIYKTNYIEDNNNLSIQKEDIKINNSRYAIYIENEQGNYELSNSNVFPSEGYVFNREESYCENGTYLEWDEVNNTLLLNTSNKDKCFIYFDVLTIDPYVVGEYGTVGEHTLTIPETGYYKLEVWGASGGSYNTTYHGGYGAYSTGIVNLTQNEQLFINVGGKGTDNATAGVSYNGGYNGGGASTVRNDTINSPDGGATHIATVTKSTESGKTGELKYLETYKDTGNSPDKSNYYKSNEILIVAGGGGGSSYFDTSRNGIGGNAGGYNGIDGTLSTLKSSTYKGYGYGGTQIAGGGYWVNPNLSTSMTSSGFGYGGPGDAQSNNGGSGGGGGFYGGGGSTGHGPGGGGSGYIASSRLISGGSVTKHMAAYGASGDYLSNDTETKTIAATGVSATAQADYAKSGDGYAIITYCGKTADSCDGIDDVDNSNEEENNDVLYIYNEGQDITNGWGVIKYYDRSDVGTFTNSNGYYNAYGSDSVTVYTRVTNDAIDWSNYTKINMTFQIYGTLSSYTTYGSIDTGIITAVPGDNFNSSLPFLVRTPAVDDNNQRWSSGQTITVSADLPSTYTANTRVFVRWHRCNVYIYKIWLS